MNLPVIKPLSKEVYYKKENILSCVGYEPFEERTLSLISSFERAIHKRFTESLGENVYSFRDIIGHYGEPINEEYKGVYKFGSLSDYIGNIPAENQNEIIFKYNKLKKNAFISFDFKLCVLAPINNFASENNIKAIDPIVFVYFREHKDRGDYYLIPLTHWV